MVAAREVVDDKADTPPEQAGHLGAHSPEQQHLGPLDLASVDELGEEVVGHPGPSPHHQGRGVPVVLLLAHLFVVVLEV